MLSSVVNEPLNAFVNVVNVSVLGDKSNQHLTIPLISLRRLQRYGHNGRSFSILFRHKFMYRSHCCIKHWNANERARTPLRSIAEGNCQLVWFFAKYRFGEIVNCADCLRMFNDIDTYMIVFHISATCIQVEILTKQFKLIFFCYQSIFIIDIFFVKVLLSFSYYFLLFAIINYQKLDKVVYKSVT